MNTRILFAAEPTIGRVVAMVDGDRVTLWESIERPIEWDEGVIPTAIDGVFFRRGGELGLDAVRDGSLPDGAVLDWPADEDPDLDGVPEGQLVACDAGAASTGTGIIAGLGLGWWRDPRPIWRKRRPARPLSAWREEQASGLAPESTESSDEASEAADV